MSEEVRIPKLAEEFDLTELDITPFQGFILSRIDGRSSVQDIIDTTGATLDQVDSLLELLGDVITWAGAPRPSRSPSSQRTKMSTPARGIVRTKPPPPGASRVLYDPVELEEDVDLDMERRREILDTFYRLDEMNHYQVLGVEREAEKRAIRDEYFRLSKLFHPDTLYGKRLGTYKTKMEGVFKRLTDAYDVLSRKKKRAKYDEYLEAHDRLMGVERGLRAGAEAADQLEQEVRETVEAAIIDPPPVDELIEPEPEPEPEPEKPAAPKRPSVSPEERKRRARALLERRLKGSTSRRPPKKKSAPRKSEPARRDDLLRGLASSLKQVAKITGGVVRIERHMADADAAQQTGDLVGAVNALRLALALDPERIDIEKRMRILKSRLTQDLAETYEKQAEYEEEQENWGAAARSWAKVVEGRPGKFLPPRRAAEALLKAEGDLRKAKDFAQMAVDLHPANLQNRLILAQVFIAAGMGASAAKELDEAAMLDPKDEIVKNLRRQLK